MREVEKRDVMRGSNLSGDFKKKRFSDLPFGYSGVVFPSRVRYDDINFYRFVAGNYVFYIKVDKRRTREPLASFVIRPHAPLWILAEEYYGGPEHRLMWDMVRANRAKGVRRR